MIWVFKTSVKNKKQVSELKPLLSRIVCAEGKWTFDLDDCDRILRIEADSLNREELVQMMAHHGFLCEGL